MSGIGSEDVIEGGDSPTESADEDIEAATSKLVSGAILEPPLKFGQKNTRRKDDGFLLDSESAEGYTMA